MDLSNTSRKTSSKVSLKSSKSPQSYLRKPNTFTPIFKKINWNKHTFLDKVNLPLDTSLKSTSMLSKRAKSTFPLPPSNNLKDDVTKERTHKHSPARFSNIHSMEKTSIYKETRFFLPAIHSDLQLLKSINQETIASEFEENKLLIAYNSNSRQISQRTVTKRRVRFQLL